MTVNPDLLLDYVVPLHGLTAVFDVIIVSASEYCADKVELCDAALSRLGFAGEACTCDPGRENCLGVASGDAGARTRRRHC